MNERYVLLFAGCLLSLIFNPQSVRTASAEIDCFNPGSTVESAVCGDPELLKSYKITEQAYARVQSNPVALGIYIDLLHARSRCMSPKNHESYKLCIIKREFAAFNAFNKLQPGAPKPLVGHGATGRAI